MRLPAEARRAAILAEAAALFAEDGFGASTRTLAARLGISQAALYKHFPSKDAIVAALFEERMAGRGADWSAALAGAGGPLADRLGDLYAGFVNGIGGPSMRLFVRAGLDGHGQPARRGAILTGRILEPVIVALRREAGLLDLVARPLRHDERELAMALHGAVVFLAIRKHVYRMPMPDDLADNARRLVRLWLPGALIELQRLHAVPEDAAVPQLAPRR
ncbi:MAG: TetR/AcrR family transcriptional regulator [Alphaproteobacteria bacterium]